MGARYVIGYGCPGRGVQRCDSLTSRSDEDSDVLRHDFHWVELIVAITEMGNPAETASPKEYSKRPRFAKIEVSISPSPGPVSPFEPRPSE